MLNGVPLLPNVYSMRTSLPVSVALVTHTQRGLLLIASVHRSKAGTPAAVGDDAAVADGMVLGWPAPWFDPPSPVVRAIAAPPPMSSTIRAAPAAISTVRLPVRERLPFAAGAAGGPGLSWDGLTNWVGSEPLGGGALRAVGPAADSPRPAGANEPATGTGAPGAAETGTADPGTAETGTAAA